jgi:hypothetical protein
MSPELPPFVDTSRARARIRAAAPRSRRVASPRTARRRAAASAASLTRGGALAVFAVGTFLLAWYAVSLDQKDQQHRRDMAYLTYRTLAQ